MQAKETIMGYMDLMRAQRQSGKPPEFKAHRWSKNEQERMQKGMCVKCGEKAAGKNSYLCQNCESLDTIDDIRKEVAAARRKASNG